jgi:hypothetical protein
MQMWLGAIVFIVAVLLYSYKRQIERARINAEMVESFLASAEYYYGLLGINFVLQGYYKDRRVTYFYRLDSEYNGSRYNLYIEPKRELPRQPFFMFSYPRPTPHTQLRGNRIYYDRWSPLRGGVFNLGGVALFTEEELRDALEELTQASQTLETKMP